MRSPRFSLALASLPILLGGCSLLTPSFDFDNPGDQPLTMQLDGQPVTIPAHDHVVEKLASGQHSLQTEALGKVDFIVYNPTDKVLVNPTLSSYYITSEVYSTQPGSFGQHDFTWRAEGQDAGHRRVENVEGAELEGDFWEHHELFIAKDWDYDVHQDFPASTAQGGKISGGGVKRRKIFTGPDIVNYLEQRDDLPGWFADHRPADWQPPKHSLDDSLLSLPPLAPLLEAQAGEMRRVAADYQKATDPSQQKALQKQFHQVEMDYVKATAPLAAKLSVDESKAGNDFIEAISKIMYAPAAVIR